MDSVDFSTEFRNFLSNDKKITNELNSQFLGISRIRISSFSFAVEDSLFRVCPRRVATLVKKFKVNGCKRSNSEHHIPALIDRELYNKISLEQDGFEDDSPSLDLPQESNILCLNGRHRVAAAKEYFLPREQWWTVRLYSREISEEAQCYLKDEFFVSTIPSDGEIFRRIRQYQLTGQHDRANRWAARLSESKANQLKQLLNFRQFREVFDRLLPFSGLWDGFRIGHLNRLNPMRCHEEAVSYLERIWNVWAHILDHNVALMTLLDETTVKRLECQAPTIAGDYIRKMVDSREIFVAIESSEDRTKLLSRILDVYGLIPTIGSFFEDVKYLEPCAKIMESLIGFGKRKKSIYRSLMEQSHIPEGDAESGYKKLWLFAMANFPEMGPTQPKKDKGKPKPKVKHISSLIWSDFYSLASSLGFKTDFNPEGAKDALEDMIKAFLLEVRPGYPETRLFSDIEVISALINNVPSGMESLGEPPSLTCPDSLPVAHRYGLPYEQAHQDDKKFLVLDLMQAPDTTFKVTPGEDISSFFVKRNFFNSFLCPEHLPFRGREIRYQNSANRRSSTETTAIHREARHSDTSTASVTSRLSNHTSSSASADINVLPLLRSHASRSRKRAATEVELATPVKRSKPQTARFRYLLGDEEKIIQVQVQDLETYFEDLAAERLEVMDKDKKRFRHINWPLVQEKDFYIKLTTDNIAHNEVNTGLVETRARRERLKILHFFNESSNVI